MDEHKKIVLEGLTRNEKMFGKRYCPCKLAHTDDNVCPCKEYREEGHCHCGLFEDKLPKVVNVAKSHYGLCQRCVFDPRHDTHCVPCTMGECFVSVRPDHRPSELRRIAREDVQGDFDVGVVVPMGLGSLESDSYPSPSSSPQPSSDSEDFSFGGGSGGGGGASRGWDTDTTDRSTMESSPSFDSCDSGSSFDSGSSNSDY
ncbi:ferredoxin-thioredoxin reductase catalytic domain-containing protein [Anaeroselena agilis]|uniref:Ferredoxin-thioredoxin reductase catalytic domain-containing protein n=1 Tax=Anaeroselena agilis TaxID=3063788 RepID=A0ABU3NVS7_9FIRM|nr:ferredoxin-thioredoxin reductase catalytic domain-containing protein [Selenomonadales bacterium 4137-cl]